MITAQEIIEAILCIILPPVAIFFHGRDCSIHVLISIVLCILAWMPGVLHAVWFCFFHGPYVAAPVRNA